MNQKMLSLTSEESSQYKKLMNDIIQLIQQGQQRVATEVNSTIVLLYWSIGKRINEELLEDKRGEYGDKIIESVSHQLSLEFGKGYSRSALFRMVRFARQYVPIPKLSQQCRDNCLGRILLSCVS